MSLIIKELLQIGETALTKAACSDPRIDAELLMCHLLSLTKSQLFIKYPSLLDEKTCQEYFELVDRRSSGVPVQYITGEQDFMGLTFRVNENVLIPRQDTETLVEEVMANIKDRRQKGRSNTRSYQILDLCCGSGAIGLSLAKLVTDVKVTASDISVKALAVAKENAKSIGVDKKVKFVQGDLFAALRKGIGSKKYHYILSNPPYIPRSVIPTLQREVRDHEPMLALDGGEEGLDFYRRIIAEAPDYLSKNGMIFMEIGYDQGAALGRLIAESGEYEFWDIIKDLAGRDRIVKAVVKS